MAAAGLLAVISCASMRAVPLEPRLGFIGVGTIASALVRGLCVGVERPPRIVLSPRGGSARLAAELGECVSIAPNNQAVVDRCDVLLLCVLPQQASEVLGALTFRDGQILVSVLSSAPTAALAAAARLPPSAVVRALPLPAVGERCGVTPLWPASHASVVALFEQLGGAIAAADERELMVLASMTSLMGQLYAQMGGARDWLVGRGIDREQARRYVTAIYAGAVSNADAAAARVRADADAGASVFDELVAEQTAGGINEQLLRELTAAGALEALGVGLDGIHARLTAPLDSADENSRQ